MKRKSKTICANCSTEISRREESIRKGNCFCDNACLMAWRIKQGRVRKNLLVFPCSYCGQPIQRWHYQKKHNQHFCNQRCQGKWNSLHLFADKAHNWKGGNYSTIANTLCNSRYRRIRKSVIALDGGKCVLCSSSNKLQVHHIIEKGKNLALIFDVTNMVTLCRVCHFGIRSREDELVGFFNEIIEKRANSVEPKAQAMATPNQTSKEEVRRDYIPASKEIT